MSVQYFCIILMTILIITDPHLVANAASAEDDKTIQNTLAIASLINSL